MSAVGTLLGSLLLLVELVLIARIVVDWVGVLAPGGSPALARARGAVHGLTEPLLAPVRRHLRPVRLGSVSIDLAFTVVFLAVVLLRTVVVQL